MFCDFPLNALAGAQPCLRPAMGAVKTAARTWYACRRHLHAVQVTVFMQEVAG